MAKPRVAVIMGSKNDWDVMRGAEETLESLDIGCDARVISAHRTPARLTEFLATAEEQGIEVVIAGAGGAAHLAGLAVGFWDSEKDVASQWQSSAHYEPRMSKNEADQLYAGWQRAMERARDWERQSP